MNYSVDFEQVFVHFPASKSLFKVVKTEQCLNESQIYLANIEQVFFCPLDGVGMSF